MKTSEFRECQGYKPHLFVSAHGHKRLCNMIVQGQRFIVDAEYGEELRQFREMGKTGAVVVEPYRQLKNALQAREARIDELERALAAANREVSAWKRNQMMALEKLSAVEKRWKSACARVKELRAQTKAKKMTK